ncbi:MAG: NFACT family protein [Elainella sp. Prado103]|nr:NFACT family protein [Elainella sp. Prado103]
MQPVDLTTLIALCAELRSEWLPARFEQVYQRDRYTLSIALRTLDQRGWLTLSWHPQAARIGMGDAPPRTPDTFTFSQQLRHQLNGLALVAIEPIADWERVIDLQFAQRPGEVALWHLFLEVMGNYSNVILTNGDRVIVTAAHQVSSQQSSVRPIQTGQPYEAPPALTQTIPSLTEPFDRWQARVSLIPGTLKRNLLKTYRGLSSALVISMIQVAGLEPEETTDRLTPSQWQALFDRWQEWLKSLQREQFQPGWLPSGYTVLGWGSIRPEKQIQPIVHRYYTDQLNQQEFVQLRHQISQKLSHLLKKLTVKSADFRSRLSQSDQADRYREQADLLMAYLQEWQPGLTEITLPDFATTEPVKIPLEPEKNAVQNAQALYKRHQKLKRSRAAIEPLLAEVQAEIDYLEQVEVAINQIDRYQTPADLDSLIEIRDELIQQRYLNDPEQRYRQSNLTETQFLRYRTPSGYEVLIGRNNRQNDQLTFRLAGDYDLWFHTQEIPGSHVLLRLDPGAAAEEPKGAKPGIAIYRQERIIWGEPQRGKDYAAAEA